MHVCPVAAKTPATSPLAAARRSASGKTICGDLPPSSRVTRLRFPAAARATARPVAVDPVNGHLVHARVRREVRAGLPGQAR
jgi:hypothetical protein